jgi:acyl carrier protein
MLNIESHLFEIISTELGIKKNMLSLDLDFTQDLHADSIDTVNILTTISAELNVRIPIEQATQLSTIGHLVEYIENQLKIIH